MRQKAKYKQVCNTYSVPVFLTIEIMTDELTKKVERAVKLIQAAGKVAEEHGQPLEIC